MSDNITLPREVARLALSYIEWYIENEGGGRFVQVREAAEALRTALAAEQPKREFDHGIGTDRFKVVRGTFWWHVKIGDSPTEHGKFRSSEAAQKMADDLLREFRNGAFVQNALAAEQPKPEPVAWMDRFGSVVLGKGPYETFTTPLYTFPPDAPTVKESLTHPGYVIGSHWLETAYSRICAGEAEADVLRDIGLVREEAFLTGVTHLKAENEALRRDAERLREALRACLVHWLNDDNPDELQENVAKFKELCGWENKR